MNIIITPSPTRPLMIRFSRQDLHFIEGMSIFDTFHVRQLKPCLFPSSTCITTNFSFFIYSAKISRRRILLIYRCLCGGGGGGGYSPQILIGMCRGKVKKLARAPDRATRSSVKMRGSGPSLSRIERENAGLRDRA